MVGKITKRLAGRPTLYNPRNVTALINLMADGNTVSGSCKALGLSRSAVYGWLRVHPDFAEVFDQAQEYMVRSMVDDMIDMTDNEPDPQKGE